MEASLVDTGFNIVGCRQTSCHGAVAAWLAQLRVKDAINKQTCTPEKEQEHAINTIMTVSEVALDMLILDTTIFRYDFEHKVMPLMRCAS